MIDPIIVLDMITGTKHIVNKEAWMGEASKGRKLCLDADDITEHIWLKRFMVVELLNLSDAGYIVDSVQKLAYHDELLCKKCKAKIKRVINARNTKDKKAQAILDNFRDLPSEFGMLKGILCARNSKLIKDDFNGMLIAERMDELQKF